VRRSAPRPLSIAVEALARTVAPVTPLARVQAAWAEAVGEAVAENATPLRLRDGVLTVACRQAVWAQELALMAPELAGALNRALGEELVTEIRTTATTR